ncbi:nuclease-related domain-containing protein [Phycicoccus sp. Root101]|uniref:nuclease-related domain-containing protein n=1 Tax=Phycicoccus sp. Root101 TaxID=1736421 RepID=UPI000AE0FF31|nr:nuclease-related domain-containing protein [Phycicoccus sp. Root101]
MVRTELWSGRRNIVAAAAWMLGAALVVVVLPVGPAMVRGAFAGALVTSWAWMVFVTSLIRTYPVTMGEWGESFTREVLESREFGWPFLDDVPMEKRNIDHVAVSPRAVLAIETKFVGAGRQWATDRYREAAMDGARSSARSVRSILRSQGVRDVSVEAVLIIWGPGARQLENDWAVVDEVHVVRGVAAADAWRRYCKDGDISGARAKELHGILASHQAMRDAHTGAKTRQSHEGAGCLRPRRPRSRQS